MKISQMIRSPSSNCSTCFATMRALIRISLFVTQTVIIFVVATAGGSNDIMPASQQLPFARVVRTEDIEGDPLLIINDTHVTVPSNVTEELQEDIDAIVSANLTEDVDDHDTPILFNASLSSNNTLSPSSSPPIIDSRRTESPVLSTDATSSLPISITTEAPTSSSTSPPDVSLTIQSINIVILTDIHSWVQGHGRHEPNLNADLGDILSFYQRLKQQLDDDDAKPDIYLVNNGDFLHGTLLGDDPPEYLLGILERIPFDAVNLGEHELINSDSLEMLQEPGGLFDELGERFVTSNIRQKDSVDDNEDKWVPLGNNYLLLHGQQGSLLVLGFLYNLNEDQSSNKPAAGLAVVDVEDILQEGWFTSLFASCMQKPQFDAIVVLAHMNVNDELITLLLSEFRKLCGESMVVQFITGHTHIRSFVELDSHSSSIEAGRFLDTVGFVSFEPKVGSFTHNFIPANKASLARSLDMSVDQYRTRDGYELTEYIDRTMDHAGANEILGCAPKHFNETELLGLYLDEVIPTSFLNNYHTSHNVLIQYVELFVGYDLFAGVITWNDIYTVMPLDYDIVTLGSVHGSDILRIMNEMSKDERRILDNSTDVVGLSKESKPGSSAELDSTLRYNLHTLSKDASQIISIMNDLGIQTLVTVFKEKTMRDIWIDYIEMQMPYDGHDCKCKEDSNGCDSSGNAGKTTQSSHYTNPQSPTTGSQPSGGMHNSNLGSSHSSGSNKSSLSSATVWTLVIIAGGVVIFLVRVGRKAARRPEFVNDLEMEVSPPPGYGDVSRGSGGYSSPHLGRFV